MYCELRSLVCRVLGNRSTWTDGEIWTSFAGGIATFCWFKHDSNIIIKLRAHFGDLLSTTSIVFGFALAALLFYIQAAGAWAKDEKVKQIANQIVDWHVWTIVCMLILIGYMLALWSFGIYIDNSTNIACFLYAFLCFQLFYCGLQILNHALTIWWTFQSRDKLNR